jgi:hypothetical protein
VKRVNRIITRTLQTLGGIVLPEFASVFEQQTRAEDQVEPQGYPEMQDYCEISSTLVMTYLGYSFTMIWPYLGKLYGSYILPHLL